MIKLQEPTIPLPTMLVDIDKAIHELQLRLDTNLSWLSHSYARAYRFVQEGENRLYFPEIYVAGDKKEYYRVTPDNDKSGMCFFVVGNEVHNSFLQNNFNYISWDIGIVFSANLEIINKPLLQTEYFQQNLIRDVREVLTRKLSGLSFTLEIENITTNFDEIYQEFVLQEKEGYLRSPLTGFRVNCKVTLQEECDNFIMDWKDAIVKNLSQAEKTEILKSLDFKKYKQVLSPKQIIDINA